MQQHLPFTVLKLLHQSKDGSLQTSVATAPTVYGIETIVAMIFTISSPLRLQQHLPFTVLKLLNTEFAKTSINVATAPTVYGIETGKDLEPLHHFLIVATAPTVYGIETKYNTI